MSTDDYIIIRGRKIPAVTMDVDQSLLRFWSDNPRVYSLLDRSGDEPEQDAIYERMLKLEHVRVLRSDIVQNEGLIDPIIVRDGDMVVLEGNSRLAAYRFLEQSQPGKWTNIRCRVLPSDLSEADIYAMLGQYHVKGKKDWVPYEKAGFVYRRHKWQKVDVPDVAAELGISAQAVRHMVEVYQFMLDNGDESRDRWSHYDEYLKNRSISKARSDIADFDEKIVDLIKGDEIRAVDVREQLPVICSAPKVLKKFSAGKLGFATAFEDARYAGADSVELSKIKRFRSWISGADAMDDIVDHNKTVRDKLEYELRHLEKRIGAVRKELEKHSTRLKPRKRKS